MKTTAYGLTDVGMQRENNEDCFLIDDSLRLFVVCDGVGGHSAGEVASRDASQALHEFLRSRKSKLDELRENGDLKAAQDLVVQAVRHASRVVREDGETIGHFQMSTTATLLLAIGDRAVIASVGDSRAYHCRKKEAKLLTQDHTLANEMLITGEFTPEQARNSPFNHYLTRSVGRDDDVEVDTLVAHLVPGDVFLLCTDGLTRYFESDSELGEYMFSEPSQIPEELVAYANAQGGKDNVTVLVVHVDVETEEPRSKWQRWFKRVA